MKQLDATRLLLTGATACYKDASTCLLKTTSVSVMTRLGLRMVSLPRLLNTYSLLVLLLVRVLSTRFLQALT